MAKGHPELSSKRQIWRLGLTNMVPGDCGASANSELHIARYYRVTKLGEAISAALTMRLDPVSGWLTLV